MHIGKRLKEMRKRSGKSQEQISQGIISASHFSNIEAGRFEPSQDILYLLADRLGVPFTYFEDVHNDNPKTSVLLQEYKEIIEGGDPAKSEAFYQQNLSTFEFIPSLNQELFFSLLRILDLLNANRVEEAENLYTAKVANYVDTDRLYKLSPEIQEKYYYVTGLIHYNHKNHQESISNFEKTISLTNNEKLRARLIYNIALSLFFLYEYRDALDYAIRAKDCYLNLHDWFKTADCYNLTAALYKEQKNLTMAEVYLNKGLDILKNNEHVRTFPILLHNLAVIKIEQNKYKEALDLLDECIKIKKQHNHDALFNSYRSRLEVFLKNKNFEKIELNLEEAKATCKKESDFNQIHIFEAYLLKHKGDLGQYEKIMDKLVKEFYEHEDWKSLRSITKELSDYYSEKKQYKKAYTVQGLDLHATKKIYREL